MDGVFPRFKNSGSITTPAFSQEFVTAVIDIVISLVQLADLFQIALRQDLANSGIFRDPGPLRDEGPKDAIQGGLVNRLVPNKEGIQIYFLGQPFLS